MLFSEMEAWGRISTIKLSIWEAETLKELSIEYLEACKLEKNTDLPPLLTEERAKELRNRYAKARLENMMQMNKKNS